MNAVLQLPLCSILLCFINKSWVADHIKYLPFLCLSAGNWFSCDICNIILNSIEQYQAHISGSKHKNNLKGMVTTESDRLSPTLNRKPFGGPLSSNRLFSSEAPKTGFSSSTGGLSSPGVYSSIAGNFSSSHGLPSAGSTAGEGLLPLPPYAPQTQRPYARDMMGPDSYNYFNEGY